MNIIEEKEPEKKISEAQKKATKKYRDNNKEKVNLQRKKYYKDRIASDPEFVEYKRQKAKEYYHRKKALQQDKELIQELPIKSIEIEEVEQLPISEVIIIEEIEAEKPKKRTRVPRKPKIEFVNELEEQKPIEVIPEPIVDKAVLNIVPIAVKKNRTRK